MGYMVELNTLIGIPEQFDKGSLKIGETYTIRKGRERAFPLNIAMLIVDGDWKFYGYGVANRIEVENQETVITFKVLSLFTEEESSLYSSKFIEAGRQTGEVKA